MRPALKLARIARRARQYWRRKRRRVRWNRWWDVESRRPESELSTALPTELVEAVESGWIQRLSSVMDVGSGRGQISAWLAERGFEAQVKFRSPKIPWRGLSKAVAWAKLKAAALNLDRMGRLGRSPPDPRSSAADTRRPSP